MALILHKDHIEEDEVYNITCKLDGDNPIFISRIYTFPNTKANSEMEAVIERNETFNLQRYIEHLALLPEMHWVTE